MLELSAATSPYALTATPAAATLPHMGATHPHMAMAICSSRHVFAQLSAIAVTLTGPYPGTCTAIAPLGVGVG